MLEDIHLWSDAPLWSPKKKNSVKYFQLIISKKEKNNLFYFCCVYL